MKKALLCHLAELGSGEELSAAYYFLPCGGLSIRGSVRLRFCSGSWRQNTVKDNFKPTWLSSTVPNARVRWFMTTSQSCLQTVWQPRQTQILNSVRCRPIPFHLQHLPCTRTTAQHKSALPAPGELSPGLLQLVRVVSGDRISTLMLSIDLCLIYLPLIWFSSRRHEYKSKVTPTRVRSYAGFKLMWARLRFLNSSLSWCKERADFKKISCLTHRRTKSPGTVGSSLQPFFRIISWTWISGEWIPGFSLLELVFTLETFLSAVASSPPFWTSMWGLN